MYLVNAQEMRELDRQTIEELGIPAIVLMEMAGRAVAQEVRNRLKGKGRITVLAGHGNNGGDGFVAARHLAETGFDVKVWLIGKKERLSAEGRRFLNVCERLHIPTQLFTTAQVGELQRDLEQSLAVIDSMLGIGLRGDLRPPIQEVIRLVNRTRIPLVVAVDVPSGVATDDGAVCSEAIDADCTVTFAYPKWCHYLSPAAERTGDLIVADIGIPVQLAAQYPVRARVTDAAYWSSYIKLRPAFSHKGTFGHALVIGGSRGMSGAPALTSHAALKTGAGLVTTAVPQGIQSLVASYLVEGLTWGLGEGGAGEWHADTASDLTRRLPEFDVVAIGPGLGRFPGDQRWLRTLLEAVQAPVVLDADALNMAADDLRILESCAETVVLTPHPGEMARLMQQDVRAIEENRPQASLALAQTTGAIVVLKGRHTITAFPDGRQFVNTTGTPAMAKAGSGDVLTGMIAATIAQGYPLEAAVPLAVSWHGCAGELAANQDSESSVLATDLVQHIGPAFHQMTIS